MFYIHGEVIFDQFNLGGRGPIIPKVNVRIVTKCNFLVKTKHVYTGLKFKINPGSGYQIIPLLVRPL